MTTRAKLKVTSTVCGEYWGLTGTVLPERITRGYKRDRTGEVIEIETLPCRVIEFDDNDEFRERSESRGSVGLTPFLCVLESDLLFLGEA